MFYVFGQCPGNVAVVDRDKRYYGRRSNFTMDLAANLTRWSFDTMDRVPVLLAAGERAKTGSEGDKNQPPRTCP